MVIQPNIMVQFNWYKQQFVDYMFYYGRRNIVKYTKPVSELEKFAVCDVVTTSGSTGPIVTPGAE